MTVQLAIIGAGAIGAQHADAARAAGLRVAAVVDPDLPRAQQLAQQCEAASYDSADALWNDSSISAVVIGVPNCFHKELALAAMRAGKDVLLEKPMGLNAAECQEMNDVAADTDRLLQIGFVHRYTAIGAAAKECVARGDIGQVYHAKAHLYGRRNVPGLGGWFTTKALSGGGALIDLGVHLLDLSLHVMDFPNVADVTGKVYAKFGRRMKDYVYENMWAGPPNYDGVCDVEDSAHALIEFADGATLDLQVAWAGNFPSGALPTSQVGFFGDQGGITFELFGNQLHLAHELHGRNVDTTIPVVETEQFSAQMTDFARSIESRHVRGANGLQGQTVQEIVDAIYQSSGRNGT